MSHKLAIVGGTGAVGRVFIDYLNNHKLDLDEIKIVASKRSAGKIIKIENSEIKVEDIESFNFFQAVSSFTYNQTFPLRYIHISLISTIYLLYLTEHEIHQ